MISNQFKSSTNNSNYIWIQAFAKVSQLTEKIATRKEEMKRLEDRMNLEKLQNEMAGVLRKTRDLIGWYFDSEYDDDVAKALEMCKSEGLDREYQAVLHKPLDLETLTRCIRFWMHKDIPAPV